MKRRIPKQTHIRIFEKDKERLELFMRKRALRGQASALRIIFRKAGL